MVQQLRTLLALLEDPGFDSQIHRAAQLALTPVPRNLAPSSGLHRHQACTQCTDIEAGKIPIHIAKLNKLSLM